MGFVDLAPTRTVFVHGENWSAESSDSVRKGNRVQVVAVRGLKLQVRKDRED